MSNKSLKSCGYNTFVQLAKEIVMPAYYGKNGGPLKPYHATYHKNFRDNFYKWLDSSWNKYNQNNCDSFNISYQKLNEQVNKSYIANDEYQKAIIQSKIRWNQRMNTECGCINIVSSPVSIIEETRLDTGENIEVTPPPVRQVRTQRAVQQRRIQPRSTPSTSSGSGY